MKYDGLIKKIYYDPAGFGSVQETYKDVKKLDSSITVKDVRDWFERNVERKKQLRGFNSYISKGPRDEYEVDLFDMRYLEDMSHGFPYGFLAIDNFTKYMWIIPIENKETPELIRAMGEIVKAMGNLRKFIVIMSQVWKIVLNFRNGWKNTIFYTLLPGATQIRRDVL